VLKSIEVTRLPIKSKRAPYHGRNILRWCDQKSCNIPVLSKVICPNCGHKTRKVDLAPPFDVRPAFKADIHLIQKTINQLFGKMTGTFITERGPVLLNASSYLDRQDEVIINGMIVGLFRYSLDRSRFEFHPKIPGAIYIWHTNAPKLHWVKVDHGAVSQITQGMNVLIPGILDFDETIEVDDPVIIVSPDDQVLATGIAKESFQQIRAKTKGMAVKAKDHLSRYKSIVEKPKKSSFKSWNEIAKLHESYIRRKEQIAMNSINWAIEKYPLPVTVAFSGGKDSLVTLELVRKVTEDFSVLYLDTGLELPETTPYVHKAMQELGLSNKLVTRRTDPQVFWDTALKLGPPGVDFRWCCKTSKLGPLNTLIRDSFQQQVLSFVGQRRYESQARAKSSSIWRNPWVSHQIGVSPIKDWTALDVWLYIMLANLPYNPLYDRGYSRVGCWLCPASKIAHFLVLKNNHNNLWQKWIRFLEEFKNNRGLPEEWLLYGLWRWKELPSKFQPYIKEKNDSDDVPIIERSPGISFSSAMSPCVGPVILKGKIIRSEAFDLTHITNLLKPYGKTSLKETSGIILFKTSGINFKLFKNGRFYINLESSENELRELAVLILMAIIRGLDCTGCGACVGTCLSHALSIADHKIWIDENCNGCLDCYNICPMLTFGHSHLEEHLSNEINQRLEDAQQV